MSRKLASIRIVSEICPIDGADKIEVAKINYWKVVVGKGEFTVGSLVVYFEIDSWIPKKIAPFLCKDNDQFRMNPKKFNEIEGERLRTVKLRGQISQGLIMNISDIIKVVPEFADIKIEEGLDVTDILGITKWEIPSSIDSFHTKGNFPSFLVKTDQERIQNLMKKFSDLKKYKWEVTEKLDGSSMTIYVFNNQENTQEGVCSRNLDLKKEIVNEVNGTETTTVNSFWEIAIREKLIEKIKESGLNIGLQGELIGSKIGLNIYKLTSRDFYLFDIYDIDNGRYYTPSERQAFAEKYKIKHVPILHKDYEISETTTVDDLLKFAEEKSVLNSKTEREGLVFKNTNGSESFKVISNKFLMKIG